MRVDPMSFRNGLVRSDTKWIVSRTRAHTRGESLISS